MIIDSNYRLTLIEAFNGTDNHDDNVDVEVTFSDGSRFVATFFTLANIASLLKQYEQSGECLNGTYFWASDMVIVRELTREAISQTIDDLIQSGEFESAFSAVTCHAELARHLLLSSYE